MDLPFENLLHRSRIEYLTVDQDLQIVGFSDAVARLAHDRDSVKAGGDVRLGFPELVGAEEELEAILRGERTSYGISNVCRSSKPDDALYVNVTVERNGDQAAPSSGLVVMVEDVTAWMCEIQKQTQTANDATLLIHAMSASKAYVENLFAAMAEMLIVTSRDGIINAVNRATLTLSGYSMPEIIGHPITVLLPDELPDPVPSEKPHAMNTELRFRTRRGELIPVNISRARLGMDDGLVHGVVYLGHDLRETREAEEKISKLETVNLSLHRALTANQETSDFVWSSPLMGNLMRDLAKVAAADTTVLISGETGTGKELVARAIHKLSRRKDSLFVVVNCAALPDGIVESELFGHEKGAFTGALQRHIGKFELADGGTVFLDEVAELPLATQATLLRVLQEQSFERVGGSQTVRVDVRVLSASNRDMEAEVRKGRVRADLLFRLNVFPLHVPPLRDRLEDIPLLAEHCIRIFSRRTNRQITGLTRNAIEALKRYTWPGNVRELANVIERAMIVCEGNVIDEADCALLMTTRSDDEHDTKFDDMARKHLLRTLSECGGVIEGPRGAAAKLGIKPATLRSRMKKLGIQRSRGDFGPST
jgi:PAS domain S-box-containing protein